MMDASMESQFVDLCVALAASNPYNRVESILMQYGIQVDRDTVKRYALAFSYMWNDKIRKIESA